MAGIMDQLAEAAKSAAEASQKVADLADQAMTSAPVVGAVVAHGGVSPFLYLLASFVLACFVGYYVVWSVTPALHTPLMSVTNAVSSVIVVGALIALSENDPDASKWTPIFGFIGTVLAAVNIFGGFTVTGRMLAMYKKKA